MHKIEHKICAKYQLCT